MFREFQCIKSAGSNFRNGHLEFVVIFFATAGCKQCLHFVTETGRGIKKKKVNEKERKENHIHTEVLLDITQGLRPPPTYVDHEYY